MGGAGAIPAIEITKDGSTDISYVCDENEYQENGRNRRGNVQQQQQQQSQVRVRIQKKKSIKRQL